MVLYKRLLCRLVRLRGCFSCPIDVTSPDQNSPILVSGYALGVNQFFFEDIQILIIQLETHLERSIGHTSLAFQKGNDLFEDFVKRHDRTPLV
jgi:hypothetical protein